jgi:hypothetical protein|tara:strand:- start:5 stop:316 length:312 start_codon:yes stop_codon:yes gene_type:complete
MKADKYLESIGLENVIDEEFFNDDDKSWYKVQELMEAYHQSKLDLLTIPDVIERFALIQWINGQPLIDGSDSFNTKEDALKHWQTLPKIDNVIYTVCRIRNVL